VTLGNAVVVDVVVIVIVVAVVVVVVVVVIVVVLLIAESSSVISAVMFADLGEVDFGEVTEDCVLTSSVLVTVDPIVVGVTEVDSHVLEVVALVDVEAEVEEEVVLETVELVDCSVGLKCGLVYSLNFGNLFNRLAMGSLKERLINARFSYSSVSTFD